MMMGTSLVPASRILGSIRSQAEAITTPLRRSFSTPRSGKANRQTSRFKRAGAAGEGDHASSVIPSSPTSAPESLLVASAKPTRPLAHRHPSPQKPKPVDPSSKEYKRTERKVISIIVGLPVLFVTSYYLYDRLSPFLAQRLSTAQQQHPEQRS